MPPRLVNPAMSLTVASSWSSRVKRAQAAPVKLRVGTGTVEANAQIFYAADMGFFKKNNLDIEVVKLRSGTTTMAASAGLWSRSRCTRTASR